MTHLARQLRALFIRKANINREIRRIEKIEDREKYTKSGKLRKSYLKKSVMDFEKRHGKING